MLIELVLNRFRPRLLGLGAGLSALGPLGLWGPSLFVARAGRRQIARDTANLRGDVAILLGAGLRKDGTPSPMLEDRLLQGLRLFQHKRVPRLMISGFKPHSAVMYEWLITRGVPQECIHPDHAGHRTLITMLNAAAAGYQRPVICTQDFHLPRALWLASKMGLHGVGFPVDRQVYSNLGRARRREQIARLRAFVDVYGLQMTQTNPL